MYVGPYYRNAMSNGALYREGSVSDRWDRVFRVLSSEPRRKLILTLRDRCPSNPVTLPDAALSPHYAGTPEEMRVELVHKHLPLLEETGYVTWTSSPFEAARGPDFGEVDAVMGRIVSAPAELPDQLVRGCRALEGETSAREK